MKLYSSIGPNPRMVRLFMAERGAVAELVKIDLMRAENRGEPFLQKNPAGQTPALELDDGTFITEITAICEYLDEVTPGPSLIGATPEQRAETRMWTRRIDLNIAEPMTKGHQYGDALKMFETRTRCIPEAAPALRQIARERLAWLDGLMEGRSFVCGDRFSMADIFLYAFLEFGQAVGQGFDPDLSTIPGWFETIAARLSTTRKP